MTRNRLTWRDHFASQPPALPGYGTEDQDHPAHMMDDPDYDEYAIGDSSDFGEDVFHGDYPESPPPALPGYGTEDQDHPAHNRMASDSLLRDVHRRSKKALRLAQATLGKNACMDALEDQAVDYLMGMDEEALDASLVRALEPPDIMTTEYLDMRMASFEARMEEMLARTASQLRQSLVGTPSAPPAAKPKVAARTLIAMFEASDLDGDGFVLQEEWQGAPSIFAALDKDKDGILAYSDVTASKEEEKPEDDADHSKEASTHVAGGGKEEKPEDEEEPEDEKPDDDEEEEDEEEEEGSDKEASFFDSDLDPLALDVEADDDLLHLAYTQEPKARTASRKATPTPPVDTLLRPQGKKASTGVKTIGPVRVASNRGNEIDDLASLWNKAPDVKDAF